MLHKRDPTNRAEERLGMRSGKSILPSNERARTAGSLPTTSNGSSRLTVMSTWSPTISGTRSGVRTRPRTTTIAAAARAIPSADPTRRRATRRFRTAASRPLRKLSGTRAGPAASRLVVRVQQDGRPVVLQDEAKPLQLDLLHAAECAPDRHAELVTADVSEPVRDEIVRRALRPPAVGAVAVEHDRRAAIAFDQRAD